MRTRTTLTLDDDVAARLEQLRRKSKATFKDVVNRTLREGLDHIDQPKHKRKKFVMATNPSPSLLQNVDNIGEVLALLEGELYR